jgi:hypothetical protein
MNILIHYFLSILIQIQLIKSEVLKVVEEYENYCVEDVDLKKEFD